MLLSALTKRALVGSTVEGVHSAVLKRYISFSPFSSSSDNAASNPKHSSDKHWSSNESGASSDGANSSSSTGAASSASASYNYDKSSIDRIVNFNVAVAFQPKNRTKSNVFTRNKKLSAAETSPSGEDNLFVSQQSTDGYFALGVADGVGGWAEAGYDSSAISRELCHSMKTIFESGVGEHTITPKTLLCNAFDEVLASPKVEIGGTTACLGIFSPDRRLKVANLGDSWCGVFRNSKLVEETQFQTHNFNTPYQLAKIPQSILQAAARQGKNYITDTPKQSDEYEWQLQKGDVVLFATDGVTDNVVPQDIEVFLKDKKEKNTPLPEAATSLVKEVVKVSKDQDFPSAFAQELSRLTGQKYLGGKEDDVTVVMVEVL
ncbi:hypothetical protein FT663_04958 [Candidozyma haemuli var. vulneris]|uniref:Protein phosphatase n=1 Tax=Candidozyma haemuli TaxID=45357 RepID=A0A2V1ATM2_9ASCO|nr:hypothetical protein CXQ85_004376 [[Candida] haemuloni]KAF3985672.1 hypothetical protein FT662_05010 [[Candida] haemuloni var. vulneris]KAF3986274.1 hypothetical protein FT663_04958 [[Candida] haemuloni var. vulneris]PVH20866.1 hypothetical protein CXQ85_004376 [[Candida] haemuloni]